MDDAAVQKHIAILQRERLLKGEVMDRKLGTILEKYVAALSHVIIESRGAAGRAPYSDASRQPGYDSGSMQTPLAAWADALLRRHERWLLRQLDELEGWMDSPYPPGKGGSCSGCGRGMAKGWKYCPTCGSE